ncbi:hypothetical protein CEXT_444101, partial [Caerostris extrusa]
LQPHLPLNSVAFGKCDDNVLQLMRAGLVSPYSSRIDPVGHGEEQ